VPHSPPKQNIKGKYADQPTKKLATHYRIRVTFVEPSWLETTYFQKSIKMHDFRCNVIARIPTKTLLDSCLHNIYTQYIHNTQSYVLTCVHTGTRYAHSLHCLATGLAAPFAFPLTWQPEHFLRSSRFTSCSLLHILVTWSFLGPNYN
jgi:hypothetical protein